MQRRLQTLSWIILLSLGGTWGCLSSLASTRDATTRCAVQDCLCSVRPEVQPPKHGKGTPRNVLLSDRLVIYFAEDQSNLDAGDIKDIQGFLRKNSGASSFQVTGHADVCGNADYNLHLGSERAESVAAYIQGQKPDSRTHTRSLGEQSASAHHEYYRKVEISTSQASTLQKPPGWMDAKLRECSAAGADVFLLDGSGSMTPYWPDILSFRFPQGSRVYLSIMNGCSNGSSIASVQPQSGTEIWYSYWKVIDQMKPGQTLCLASDFMANVALKPIEAQAIEQKIHEKGIRVMAIHY